MPPVYIRDDGGFKKYTHPVAKKEKKKKEWRIKNETEINHVRTFSTFYVIYGSNRYNSSEKLLEPFKEE